MNASDIPAAFPIAFASSAAGAYIRAIPTNAPTPSGTDAPAGLDLGFPPQTFATSGAIPPNGKDFNGLFNQITAWLRFLKAGAPIPYDAAFSTAIGGYPKGAQLISSVTPGLIWISLADGNTTNPDGTSPANWIGGGAAASGSNSNGFWEYRPSGVLEQWGTIAMGSGSNVLSGTQTMPQAFLSAAFVPTGNVQKQASPSWHPGVFMPNPASTTTFTWFADTCNVNITFAAGNTISWRAIGRWY